MVKLWFLTKNKAIFFTGSVLLILFLFPVFSFAEEEYRAWPGEFLRMGAGARAMGMGNAYTAVEGDIYSSYFNPAGLASMEGRQLAISMRYLSMDRKFMHLVYGGKIGPDADFALSWIQSGTDDIIGRDLNGKATGSLEDKRNSIGLSFARNISKWFAFGLNTKLTLWKLGGEDAKAYGFDIGTIIRPVNRLAVSFVVRDVNSRFTWKSKRWSEQIMGSDGQTMEKEDKFPAYYTLGLSYKLFQDKLILSAALENVEDNPAALNLGISYEYNQRFTLRTGMYNYTSSDEMDSGSFTFGFSAKLTRSLDIDYTYVPTDFNDESIHLLSLVVNYGE